MGYENTKVKGDEGELEVLCYLKRRGYSVALPFGENAPYDLIVESPSGRLYRLQVRWASWTNGVLPLRLRIVSKNYSKTIDQDRIDIFALWDGKDAYFIPTAHTKGYRSNLHLRRTPPKNNQKKRIRMASDYRDALKFLE